MAREIIRRRNLPHWDVPGAPVFVTTCLNGSIPAQGLLQLARFRDELRRQLKPPDLSLQDWQVRCWKRSFTRTEEWLDVQPARRDLASPAMASIVVNALFHFAGDRYDLWGYVVMPSHLHWLFQPRPQWLASLVDDGRSPRERIVYSVNRFTATRCNQVRGATGAFWQAESYDHWVRDADELERILLYIEANPVKARLVESPEQWRFSSAWVRKANALDWGLPLLKGMELVGQDSVPD